MIGITEALNLDGIEASPGFSLSELTSGAFESPDDGEEPPEYFSLRHNSDFKLPSYLASVLQPEPPSNGSINVIQSYAIMPHDTRSVVILSPDSALSELESPAQRSFAAQLALRIYGGSVFLFRKPNPSDDRQGHSSSRSPKDVFSHLAMEGSLNRFFKKNEARLDDWREDPKSRHGKYRLKSNNGVYAYRTSDGQKRGWLIESTGCFQLIDLESPQRPPLAYFKPASVAASSLSDNFAAINHSTFKPGFYGARSSFNKLNNFIGRLDLVDQCLLSVVEQELAILTCAVTHVLFQRSNAKSIK